jgi:predicted transposase/invertase (TIGR01784 family)
MADGALPPNNKERLRLHGKWDAKERVRPLYIGMMQTIYTRFLRLFHDRKIRREARENAAQGKPLTLDLTLDVVFKALFIGDNPDSREALASLISACIHRPVTDVVVLDPELIPDHLRGKVFRLDVLAAFNDGEKGNLEMQTGTSSTEELKNRSSVYASRMLSSQALRGKEYRDMKRVYQIFFLDFVLFPKSTKLPRRYRFLEETEHDELTDLVEVIYYEIPKLEQKLEQKLKTCLDGGEGLEQLSAEERWCAYFLYKRDAAKRPLITKLCEIERGIMKAEQALGRISRNEMEWARAMSQQRARMDYYSDMDGAERKGEERERAKAWEEKRAIVRNMQAAGLSVEQIATFTGLPPEEIAAL